MDIILILEILVKNRVAALKSDTLFKLNLSNNYLDETANMHHPAILDFKQIIVRVYLSKEEFFCNSTELNFFSLNAQSGKIRRDSFFLSEMQQFFKKKLGWCLLT